MLTLKRANRLASKILAAGEGHPFAVAVVDEGGNLLVLKRHEDAGFFYVEMSRAKAWAAVALRRGVKASGEALMKRALLGALTDISDGRFLPIKGSVLLRDRKKRIVGAVGVAGPAGGDNDEAWAVQGAEAVGLKAEV